ncbi:polysaccharide deacetylase family protein [Paenibacillus sp. P96]|uniref:Polysaccharide deacetylase family protein n=1 Tax=Paenibacillus zeirhizosphaerae TaxID=2987519 RepID=A0ABT9FVG9_9BACL|nr:polysaccharide deacetylase family protein [Paenibacillus sp. P96]MDP4098664.1 polysaccharide deacetylase family protein [Paenibacillus sp. P96]
MFRSLWLPGILIMLHMAFGHSSPPLSSQPHTIVKDAAVITAADESSLSKLRKKYADTFKMQGPRTRQIALTFDDAPDPRFTPYILDALKKNHVKATFFVVGYRAEKYPELVKRMVQEGHTVGNHSFGHPNFNKISLKQFQRQIVKTDLAIEKRTGYKPLLIRPPYGEISEAQLRWTRQKGYTVVNWNVDSMDWKGLNKDRILSNVIPATGPGSIILMHAGGGTTSDLRGTIAALPPLIRTLQQKGYTFVTIPQQLDIQAHK